MRRFLFLLLLVSLTWSVEAFGATFYVNDDASGANNGTSWGDAWTSLSAISAIVSGDIVYIAAGSYGSMTPQDANTTFRRATVSEHGSSVGWLSSMDGQVMINGIVTIGVDGVTLDGVTRYGIRITQGSANGGVNISGTRSDIILQFVEIDGSGESSPYGGPCAWRGLRIHSGYTNMTNILISNCWIHGQYDDAINHVAASVTYEYCVFGPRSSPGGSCPTEDHHGDTVQIFGSSGQVVYKYNVFNWNGQNIFVGGNARLNSGLLVYGNVFRDTTYSSGAALNFQDGTNYSDGICYFYNNTLVDMYRSIITIASQWEGEARNNLLYDITPGTTSFGALTQSNNLMLGSSSIFTDYANDVLTLTSATGMQGQALAPPYDTDPNGLLRGADGWWDIGAYEYSTGQTVCYLDMDGDGYSDGTYEIVIGACSTNYYTAGELIAVSGDCEDTIASANPGATEICGNGIDDDCANGDETCSIPGESQTEFNYGVTCYGCSN